LPFPISLLSQITFKKLWLNCSSAEELHDVYNKLSVGGNANHTPRVEFWGDTFGMLTDKYDVDWMLSYKPQA
jgi:PhnB protein